MDELTVGHATDLVAKELINRIRYWLSMNEKERAVIEAAKEWWLQGPACETVIENTLADAVEALLAAEGEG